MIRDFIVSSWFWRTFGAACSALSFPLIVASTAPYWLNVLGIFFVTLLLWLIVDGALYIMGYTKE